MTRTLKTVVQVRSVRQDKLTEDPNKVRGVEVELRSVQFVGVQDIEAKLKDLTQQGVIWAKYGLWPSETLSAEDNVRRGQWIIFGVWPDTIKYSLNKHKEVMKTWSEPYHLGLGRNTPLGDGSGFSGV